MLKRKLCSIAGQIVLILVTILMLSPIVYMVLNSLKPYSQMLKEPWALPETLFLDNYIKAFNQMEFFQSLFNSVFITGASVAIIVILGAFSCLSDCKIPESADRIFGNLFSCRVYGADTGVDRTDIFYYEELNLINTRSGMIIVYAASVSFAIFMYQGFIRSLPIDMEESALMDGARPWQLFWKVVFPLLKPATATLVIFQTMWIWNDFTLSSLFLSSRENLTLILELQQCIGAFQLDWSVMLAIMCIVMLPMVIFYLAMQKQIIAGMTSGAVKG